MKDWKGIASGTVAPVAVIALWQAAASLGLVNPQVLPSPLAVVPPDFVRVSIEP